VRDRLVLCYPVRINPAVDQIEAGQRSLVDQVGDHFFLFWVVNPIIQPARIATPKMIPDTIKKFGQKSFL
jgi:hypothetical protein